MTRTRSKICGITSVSDAIAAAEAGADAIGLVFYPPSPRAIDARQAAEIIKALPPFVTTVGLFVDASAAEISAILDQAPLDVLQFHGDESPEFCRSASRPWIKAVRMRDDIDLYQMCHQYTGARGLLLDTYVPGTPGGTGATFNWQRVPKDLPLPVVLAGGLDADNVATAIAQVKPWAVDVSGGVEILDQQGKASAGRKSADRMRAFVSQVNVTTPL